jgi:serine/threonine-protein kinase
VVVAGVALVAVLALAGIAVKGRLDAAAQARWAQHFGQEAERIEALVRYSRLMPVHDLTRELEQVRARIRTLETDVARAGGGAGGPGAYALGRAWLAMGDAPRARAELEKARRLGFRNPVTAYSLGSTLGQLYQSGRAEAQRIAEPDVRRGRMAELAREFRDPALVLLAEGRGSTADPEGYGEGLLAFLDARFPEALALAGQAVAKAPWFIEAKALEGEIHLATADQAPGAEARREALQAARRCLAEVAALAPSDVRVREAMARLALHGLASATAEAEAAEWLLDLETASRAWSAIEPGSPVPLIRLAQARVHQARQAARTDADYRLGRPRGAGAGPRGDEPARLMREAHALLDTASALAPDSALISQARAEAAVTAARQAQGDAATVPRLLTEATGHAKRAVDLDPGSLIGCNLLLRTYLLRLEDLGARAQDWQPLHEEARDFAGRLAARYPEIPSFRSGIAAIQVELANNLVLEGRAPGDLLQGAQSALDELAAKFPRDPKMAYIQGNADIVAADADILAGRDPRLQLARARAAYQRGLAESPRDSYMRLGLAMAFEMEARWARRAGHPFQEALREARREHRQIQQQSTDNWLVSLLGIRLAHLESADPGAQARTERLLRDLEQIPESRAEVKRFRKELRQAAAG